MGFWGLITLVARGDFDLTQKREAVYACGVRFWGWFGWVLGMKKDRQWGGLFRGYFRSLVGDDFIT